MLLKVGSSGEDVKKLQTKLGVTPSGTFDAATETKVKEFQTANSLTADGLVGDGTWGKLFPTQLKLEKLKGVVPDSLILEVRQYGAKFNLTTDLRLAHFLAQCATESGNFKAVRENLNYSADGLLKIFPKYFTKDNVNEYARNPIKIADKVYSGRMGNSPIGTDGTSNAHLYTGKGYVQLTGYQNYLAFSKFIGEDCVANPDLVATKYPLASAAFFFNTNNLWSICDKGSTDGVVTAVTKRVNGGTIGLDDRLAKFHKYYNLLK